MIKTLITAGILASTSSYSAEVNDKFIKAIHMVESSGRTGNIIGDSGRALGPLQIHRSYFHDAIQFDPSLSRNYNNVTNLAFSKKVVSAYLNRYAPKAVETNNYEIMAKVHNGGPAGFKNPNTQRYWAKVEKHI
jgi:hypothetical protein